MSGQKPRKQRPRDLWRPPAGEPPLLRVEKKWRGVLTAHTIALGENLQRLPKSNHQRVVGELSLLVRTHGALDYLSNTRSIAARAFVRAVFQVFSHNKERAENYLADFKKAYRNS